MNDILGLMMTATAVESSGVTCAKIHELMHGYKKNGIDVVPISELEKAFAEGLKIATSKDSMTNSLIQKVLKGEINA